MAQSHSPFAEFIDFKMFSGDISCIKDSNGGINEKKPQVRGVGSSECEDLSGDRMLKSAMDDMAKFSVGSAIFMNHEYKVPEDIFGSLHQPPEIKIYPPTKIGLLNPDSPYYVVEIVANVAKSNDRAVKSFNVINEDGVRLGFSIGCAITDYEIRKDTDTGDLLGFDIAHLMPYEWSLVGIPCNQQSWVTNAVKGIMQKNAKIPPVATEEELAYLHKHYKDFDSITALYIKRHFTSIEGEWLKTQQEIYKKSGLRLITISEKR